MHFTTYFLRNTVAIGVAKAYRPDTEWLVASTGPVSFFQYRTLPPASCAQRRFAFLAALIDAYHALRQL